MYSPQTMAYFLEHATPSLFRYICYIVCVQLLTVLPYAAGPYGSLFVQVQRSCGGIFEHKKRFPSQFNKENQKCVCAFELHIQIMK